MIIYKLSNIEENILNSIKDHVSFMCKENNINYAKQDYKLLFSNEDVLRKNNGVRFTSGLKKYLCFYGKIYSGKTGFIVENIHLQDNLVTVNPERNSFLIISGGTDNSTIVEHDQKIMHFYVAPGYMLEMQDSETWQNL